MSNPSGHMTFIQRRINVDATSWRCMDVNATMYKGYVRIGCKFSALFSVIWHIYTEYLRNFWRFREKRTVSLNFKFKYILNE